MCTEYYTKQAQEKDKEALFQTLIRFIEGVCIYGSIDMTLSVIADDMKGIGLGEQGFYHSKAEFADILSATMIANTERINSTYSADYENVDIQIFSPSCAQIYAEVHVNATTNGQTGTNSFIQMASARKENGRWLWFSISALSMALSEKGIRSMPMKFADHTLAALKAELQSDTLDLMNKSFSCGILGTFIEADYPLFFANDTLIKMLGYEREEFEQVFKDGTTQMVYFDDHDRVHDFSLKEEASAENNNYQHARLIKKDGSIIWIDIHSKKTVDEKGRNIFLSIILDITEIIELQQKAEEQNKAIMAGIDYASKIQANLLPSEQTLKNSFSDYSIIWKPRDVVGGDIYWIKQFEKGTLLCVADCTGHGTPGALLTMLVVSALESIVHSKNCHDTAEIVWKIDRRLADVLRVKEDFKHFDICNIKEGCDLAVLFISKDRNIHLSSGNTNLYICDGQKVRRIRGQRINIGEGDINSKKEIKTIKISDHPENKYYIASDGLFDQNSDKTDEPFGYQRLCDIIFESHGKPLTVITDTVWSAFEDHRGTASRLDDFELVAFQP